MRPGPAIRRLFGPFERDVAETYRRIFVNLDDFSALLRRWVPDPQDILEVGCGEGAMTERLVSSYPSAHVTAIDISPKVGRLFRGSNLNVNFSQESVESVASHVPGSFDLVVLADVMHHVPCDARRSLLTAIDLAMAPRGILVFKDWVITASPINFLAGISDRYLTGDNVSYFTSDSMDALVNESLGTGTIRQIDRVRPWSNNRAVLVQRQ